MTTTDPFSAPSETKTAAGDNLDLDDSLGKLLLITPTSYKEDVDTKFGKKDCVVADVVVIDEKNPVDSKLFSNAWLLQGRLIGATKSKVGKGMVLGRLFQEPTTKGNPAWDLSDPTDDDRKAARTYYDSVTDVPPF